MDKDKQARLEAKGWRFGDADEFLGADAGQLEVDETYKTDNVEALVAENARLKAEVAAANKGAKTNALVNESLANKLKIAVEQYLDDRGSKSSRKTRRRKLKELINKELGGDVSGDDIQAIAKILKSQPVDAPSDSVEVGKGEKAKKEKPQIRQTGSAETFERFVASGNDRINNSTSKSTEQGSQRRES